MNNNNNKYWDMCERYSERNIKNINRENDSKKLKSIYFTVWVAFA
jgi:hypothetical protein